MITFEMNKALRNFEEYPNDIARGLNIPHMPVFYKLKSEADFRYIMAEGILTQTPEPDFSMPFNVNAVTHMIFGILFVNTIYTLGTDPKEQEEEKRKNEEEERKAKIAEEMKEIEDRAKQAA